MRDFLGVVLIAEISEKVKYGFETFTSKMHQLVVNILFLARRS